MLTPRAESGRMARVLMRVPPHIKAAIYFFGQVGSGKSCSMLSISQSYHDFYGYKIFDLYGGQRNENLYWSLPSKEEKYWKIVQKYTGEFEQDAPKQYKVNLLYPLFISKMHKRLPFNPPYVKSKIFTIPFKEIQNNQIELVINKISEEAKYSWSVLKDKMRKNDNAIKLEFLSSKTKQTQKQILYKNFIRPLVKEGLLQNDNCYLNLDLRSELKDKETISVLVLDHIPEEYHLFVIDYILAKSRDLIKEQELGKRPHILYLFREVSQFFRATDQSVQEDRFKSFRVRLSDHVRYARLGMHFFFDTQDAKETRGIVDGQQDITILGKISESESNRQLLIQPLLRDNRMTSKQAQDVKYCEPGEMTFVYSGGRYVKPTYVLMPRTMHWQEDSGNFYKSAWKDYIDKWEITKTDVENIQNMMNEAMQKHKEQEAFNKKMQKLKAMQEKEEKQGVVKEKPKEEKQEEVKEELPKINGAQEPSPEENKENNLVKDELLGYV